MRSDSYISVMLGTGKCEECASARTELFCTNCDGFFCRSCFSDVHPAKSRTMGSHVALTLGKVEKTQMAKLRESLKKARESIKASLVKEPGMVFTPLVDIKAYIDEKAIDAPIFVPEPIESLKKTLTERIQILKSELKNIQQIQRVQSAELDRWAGEVRDIQKKVLNEFTPCYTKLSSLITKIKTRAFELRARELQPILSSKDAVKEAIVHLRHAIEMSNHEESKDSKDRLLAARKHAAGVLNSSAVFEVDGKLKLMSLEAENSKVLSIAQGLGRVRMRYRMEDLYEEALVLLEKDEENLAFPKLQESAQLGYVPAQIKLAYCFHSGIGDQKINYNQALKWALEAVKSPLATPDIFTFIGKVSMDGEGTSKDIPTAVSYFRRAAECGDSEAIKILAVSIPREFLPLKDAFPWMQKAAELNHEQSMLALGFVYLRGEEDVVPIDVHKGIDLFKRAALTGYAEAQFQFALCLHHSLLQPKEAIDWYTKAALQNHLASKLSLAYIYESGTLMDIPADSVEALKWYESAATQGDASAQMRAAFLLESKTDDVKTHQAKALQWYKAAAAQNQAFAQFKYGEYLENGKGGAVEDWKEAMIQYKKAAEQGFEHAMCALALEYLEGPETNLLEAKFWYEKAKEKNVPEALFRLGTIHIEGLGVPENVDLGKEYLNLAAAAGHPQAQYVLQVSMKRGFFMSTKDLGITSAAARHKASLGKRAPSSSGG